MIENRGLRLLECGEWREFEPLMEELRGWQYYHLLTEAMRSLKLDVLYHSKIHGSGHISRVLLMSGLIAKGENLDCEDVLQYFRAASYHDVGREHDGLDLTHGSRSALKLEAITGLTGEPLRELQGAVAAHSQPDYKLEEMVRSFEPEDFSRAVELARLLKDADNLDRVRLPDLNPDYLRHQSAKDLADFSYYLFDLDQELKNT